MFGIDWSKVPIAGRDYYAQQPEGAYRTLKIPKPDGGERVVRSPEPRLKAIQAALLRQLGPRLRRHRADHCAPGLSVVTHARAHVAPQMLLTMDVSNFYDSVPMLAVRAALAFLEPSDREHVRLLCTYHGHLVTGAPTSPALASAAFYPADIALSNLASNNSVTYTRYVDDLAFSWTRPTPRRAAERFARSVTDVLAAGGFQCNADKTRVLGCGDRQVVTGLVVNATDEGSCVRVPREIWRRLRAGIHNYSTRGEGSWNALRGLVAYVQMVEPERAAPYVEQIEALRAQS